jgi:NADPH-dependent curcumin reductase CurA
MSNITTREVRLASRPTGVPTASNFTLAETTLPPLQDGQVLVRNRFMSVDPYMRGRMNDRKSYVPPFEIGKVLNGGAVGEVMASRSRDFKVGDVVTSPYGWREAFIATPAELHGVDKAVEPLSVYLGILGMTGMTAWAGLTMVRI